MIESTLLIAIALVLFILIDPYKIFLSNIILMVISVIVAAWFIAYTVFIFRENSEDERDNYHIKCAGRISFLMGAALLLTAILIQSFQHNLDIWLPIILIFMTVSKIVSLVYLNIKD